MIVKTLGSIAYEKVLKAQNARVWGVTSHGIFLHLDLGWMIFITDEDHAGPLTLNSLEPIDRSELPPIGTNVWINPQKIVFEHPDQVIYLHKAEVLTSPHRRGEWLPDQDRAEILKSTLAWTTASRLDYPLLSLLRQQASPEQPVHSLKIHYNRLQSFFWGAKCGKTSEALPHLLEPFLGLGRGLTPSGDDLILGVLVGLSRWGDKTGFGVDLTILKDTLLPQVYSKTTLLSANLIECALTGQADVRLVSALDGLVTGSLESEAIANLLACWGSSSGMDALLGMALIISQV